MQQTLQDLAVEAARRAVDGAFLSLPFRELPAELQARLIRLSRGGSGDGFQVHRLPASVGIMVRMVVGAGLLAAPALWLARQTDIQFPIMILVWSFMGVVPAGLILSGMVQLLRSVTSKVQPAVLVNKAMVVRTEYDGDTVTMQRYRSSDGSPDPQRIAYELRRYLPERHDGLGDEDWIERLADQPVGGAVDWGGMLSGCLFVPATLLVPLLVSGGIFLRAHAANCRLAEASRWAAGTSTPEAASSYLDWAESVDPEVLDARHPRDDKRALLDRLVRTRQAAAQKELERRIEVLDELELRRSAAREELVAWSLRTFTPFAAHVAKALELTRPEATPAAASAGSAPGTAAP